MPRPGKTATKADPATLAETGIAGLDDILNGGLARGRLYLVEGVPGSGKTTLADAVPDRRRAARRAGALRHAVGNRAKS